MAYPGRVQFGGNVTVVLHAHTLLTVSEQDAHRSLHGAPGYTHHMICLTQQRFVNIFDRLDGLHFALKEDYYSLLHLLNTRTTARTEK